MTVQIGRPDTAPMARGRLLAACRRGDIPAEALAPADRDHLVYDLWAAGWSDVEIATHTYMSTYTTGRIRARLGLAAHPTSTRGAA
ncbi:hypothetical protein [Amycolatopsis orientalis]|uniref:hypothetical protein n=1 Tax=Amycolatopsis orientalis TaxID=31958 RepID=UPI000A468AC1|nr:hypothetical protein [Amycolatopsis orientalis]